MRIRDYFNAFLKEYYVGYFIRVKEYVGMCVVYSIKEVTLFQVLKT